MYSEVDLCLLCLTYDENQKSILSHDNDGIVFEEKFRYVLNDNVNIEPEVSYICLHCLKNLNYVYKFKQMCLQNIKTFNNYKDTLETKEHLKVTLTDLRYQKTIELTCNNESANEISCPMEVVLVKEEIADNCVFQDWNVLEGEEAMEKNDKFSTPEKPKNLNENIKNSSSLNEEHYIVGNFLNRVKTESGLNLIPEEIQIKDECLFEATDSDSEDKTNNQFQNEGTNMPDIVRKFEEACAKLIPIKSGERYQKQFSHFCEWKIENKVTKITEEVMLAYFLDLSKKVGASSLWPKYSMIKSSLIVNENLDISRFSKVVAFLKKQSVGYESKQSKTLTREEIYRFMKEACTDKYLLTKIIAMIGIAGGCRREELYNISLDDIQETQTQLVITIPCTKTYQRRTFTIINEVDGMKFLELFRKYVSLRPKHVNHRMLFLGYRNLKCTVQRVGIHTIGGTPKQIALYLGLQDPGKYTGHSFRRASATLLANAGADLAVLKRHGAWKRSSVAEKYIEDSLENKNKISRMILNGETFVDVLQQQNLAQNKKVINKTSLNNITSSTNNYPPITIEGNTNCTINLNIHV